MHGASSMLCFAAGAPLSQVGSYTALPAVATNNSGYMFIGLIGYTYATGLAAIWKMLRWIAGDFVASLFIHRQVRIATERTDVHTFSGLLSRWQGTNNRVLRFVSGLITLLFLGTYAAAQLSAGSKALHVLFGWEPWMGAVIGAVIVLLYSFAGGIRASIWTDAAQSIVVIVAMALLMVVALEHRGGGARFVAQLQQVSPGYLELFPPVQGWGGWLGALMFIAGWFFDSRGYSPRPSHRCSPSMRWAIASARGWRCRWWWPESRPCTAGVSSVRQRSMRWCRPSRPAWRCLCSRHSPCAASAAGANR